MNTKNIHRKRDREKKVVGLMIHMYCNANHGTMRGHLCSECGALEEYAFQRVDACPHIETKTFCSSCKTHCYKADMREKIRRVMRWSGPRIIFYHPIMAVKHAANSRNIKSLRK